jgi:hypothetical protein
MFFGVGVGTEIKRNKARLFKGKKREGEGEPLWESQEHLYFAF